LLQFCSEEETGNIWRKTARFWPFTLWQVDTREIEDGKGKVMQYSQPWLGVTLFLKNIKQDNPIKR
jgi:hypothetical protein